MSDAADNSPGGEQDSAHALALLPATWAQASPLLRSVLRPATFAWSGKPSEPVAWRTPATSLLHELVELDLPEAPTIVTTEHTERWGVSSAELFAAGRANIAAVHPVVTQDVGAGGMFRDTDVRSYIGSAVLTPGWLAAFTPPPGTRTIAFMPTEDTLIVGYDDPEHGVYFFETAEQLYRDSDHPVSPQAFIECDGQVVSFDNCGLHPLRALALRARSYESERVYNEQAEFLTRMYQDQRYACHVAATHLVDVGERTATATVWSQGAVADLPAVDYVFFSGSAGERFAVPFPVVVDIVGLLPSSGFHPARYRVTGWPQPDVLDLLQFHALPISAQ